MKEPISPKKKPKIHQSNSLKANILKALQTFNFENQRFIDFLLDITKFNRLLGRKNSPQFFLAFPLVRRKF